MRRFFKRSAIEIQFNWIFVIIAGAVIFAFIIGLIMSQKGTVDSQLSQDVLTQLATNIKGKQQLSGTFSLMNIPKTTLTFTCDPNDLTSDFKITNSQRTTLPMEIIFTKREYTTSVLNIWTLDFTMPFTVTRFVYITPEDMMIVIYNSTPSFQAQSKAIYNELPSNISKRYASNTQELDRAIRGFENYRVVCFENDCPPNKYDYVSITPTSTALFGYGTIRYPPSGISSSVPSNYIGEASLFGAIFSDDVRYYDCEMKRAFKQFEVKRSLAFERVKLMERDMEYTNPPCFPIMALPESTLRDMEGLGLSDAEDLYSLSGTLKRDNTDLTFQGCPLIY